MRNAGRCHLPLCSFLLSHPMPSFREESGSFLWLHQGKRLGPSSMSPWPNPKDPQGVMGTWRYFSRGKSGEAWDHGLERSGTGGTRLERSEEALRLALAQCAYVSLTQPPAGGYCGSSLSGARMHPAARAPDSSMERRASHIARSAPGDGPQSRCVG